MKLIYIIGIPGSGKSTLVRAFIAAAQEPLLPLDEPVKATYLCKSRTLILGHYDRLFGGTDTLSYTVLDAIKRELIPLASSLGCSQVLGEGDRLASDNFMSWAKDHFDLTTLLLRVSEEQAAGRRAARGSKQSETWLAGRATKCARLAERWKPRELDGSKQPLELAIDLAEIIAS